MYKKILASLFWLIPAVSYGDDLITKAQSTYDAVRIVCSGISDEISRVSNVSKVNTAVTGTGTVAAGGALIADANQIWSLDSTHTHSYGSWIERTAATCTAAGVESMSDEYFFTHVIRPMEQIADLIEFSEHLQESKKSRIEIPTQVYGINDYYCDNGWTLVITNQGIYLKNLTKECAKLVILETRNIKKESRAVIEEINLCKELLKEYPNIKETLISETTKEKGKSY